MKTATELKIKSHATIPNVGLCDKGFLMINTTVNLQEKSGKIDVLLNGKSIGEITETIGNSLPRYKSMSAYVTYNGNGKTSCWSDEIEDAVVETILTAFVFGIVTKKDVSNE